MSKKIIFGAIASAVLAMSAGSAFAAGAVGSLSVTLGVKTGCDINGGNGVGVGTGQAALLDFGDQAQGATNVVGQTASVGSTALVVTCSTASAAPTIAFDGGQYYLGNQRKMRSDSMISGAYQYINYVLGSTSSGTDYSPNTAVAVPGWVTGTANVAQAVPVYGLVALVPLTAEGGYTDTVKVSLVF